VKLWFLTQTPNFEEEEEKNNKNNNRNSCCRPQQKSNHRQDKLADYQPGDCFKLSQFLAKKNMTVIPNPHTHLIWPPVLFPLPKAEALDKGSTIRHH